MASLQSYQSHGNRYYRIVESFRKDGKPHIRVLAHLGKVEDILQVHEQERTALRVGSVSAGAVTGLWHLAQELDVVGKINERLREKTGSVQKRDGLTVGESLLAGIIGRVCAPRSKRAFCDWAQTTYLPEQMKFAAPRLTSQHFWDQMHAVPIAALAEIEQRIVGEVVAIEQLQVQALAYDTTNFYTHIASTNLRPQLPQRGHNKQGRHDLRQLGLALVVDQVTQLPLAHVLYEGARSDMKTFLAFLEPLRKRLRSYNPDAEQLTLVFDAGASSQANLENLDSNRDHYVTAVRPSSHKALLAQAADHLTPVALSTGAMVPAWHTRCQIAGQPRDAVVVFSQQLYEGQLRGLHQQLARCAFGGAYAADLVVADAAHVAFVRSTVAHARVVGIDTLGGDVGARGGGRHHRRRSRPGAVPAAGVRRQHPPPDAPSLAGRRGRALLRRAGGRRGGRDEGAGASTRPRRWWSTTTRCR